VSVRFDDPNLVSCAGLAAVLALAARCGLATLLSERLRIAAKGGAHATGKILALVAGMIGGADSISDMALLRHGGMPRLFTDVRAPSTLGVFLRLFTFGHVRQLDAVAAGLLTRLTRAAPTLLGADRVAFLDLDDTVRRTYGYAKQGAGRGYTGVNGLNALLATISTPRSAPLIAATRLRKGSTNSVRGAAKLLADALATARRAGATGLGDRARGLGVLRLRPHQRLPPRRGPILRHRPADPHRAQGDHHHPGGGVGADQVSERDLRRGRAAVGLRRRGRRDTVHRVHRAPQGRTRDRPADRAPGPPAQPKDGAGRAGRDVSPSTATTPCSPTAPSRCWTPRPPTATTPSSSRSSPTSRTPRSPTCPLGTSAPTAPGWSAPRSRTT
jgi:hypothetical protein